MIYAGSSEVQRNIISKAVPPMTTRLWLVRHGKFKPTSTDAGTAARIARSRRRGRPGGCHGAWFKAQARPITAVYAPLQRTFNTAAGIAEALGLPTQPEPALREYGIGVLEDTPFTILRDELGFFERIFSDGAWAPEGGEAREAVEQRIHEILDALATRHAGEEIVVVSHGAALALASLACLPARTTPGRSCTKTIALSPSCALRRPRSCANPT